MRQAVRLFDSEVCFLLLPRSLPYLNRTAAQGSNSGPCSCKRRIWFVSKHREPRKSPPTPCPPHPCACATPCQVRSGKRIPRQADGLALRPATLSICLRIGTPPQKQDTAEQGCPATNTHAGARTRTHTQRDTDTYAHARMHAHGLWMSLPIRTCIAAAA